MNRYLANIENTNVKTELASECRDETKWLINERDIGANKG